MLLGIDVPSAGEFDVVGFGLNAVDHLCFVPRFPAPGSKPRVSRFLRTPGGQAASAMVLCSKLGHRAKYVGKVGADETGDFSLASIKSEGVDVSDVVTVPGVTNQLAMIVVDERDGERTILWHRPAELETRPDELTAEKVAVGRILLIDGHDTAGAARAADIAHEHGVLVVLDAESVKEGTADVVARTDVLLASREFPRRFTGDANLDRSFDALREAGPRVIGMTLGSLGSLVMGVDGSVVSCPGYDVDVVDTTGAGDVFHGAFLHGLLSGWSAERTLSFSNAAAALCCTAPGARGGVQGLEQILELMERGPRRLRDADHAPGV
ncbi:MAG: carbohydrate kinase family protein [Candidatus Eisenbacteria bacterium]